MKNTESLKKNRDFLRLYRTGKYYVGRIIVIYVKENNTSSNKIGVTTVRNFGNSVCRNRMRRLIKESYRNIEDEVKLGWDIVFSARKQNGNIYSYRDIEKEMKYLLRKTGLHTKVI